MSQAVLLFVSLLALPAFAMPTLEKLANGVTFIVVPGPGEPALVTVTIPKAGTPSPIDLAALMAATIAPSIPQRTSVDRVIFECRPPIESCLDELTTALMKPSFSEAAIANGRQRLRASMAERTDEQIIAAEIRQQLFGFISQREAQLSLASLDAVTRDDLANFHRRLDLPNNLVVLLSGDASSAPVRAHLERLLRTERGGRRALAPDVVPRIHHELLDIRVIDRPRGATAKLAFGFYASTWDDAEHAANAVLAEVLARRFPHVRVRLDDDEHVLTIAATSAISVLRDAVLRLRPSYASVRFIPSEVEDAKAALLAEHRSRTARSVATRLAEAGIDDERELARCLRWPEHLTAVTVDDVVRVGRKTLQPQVLTILGDAMVLDVRDRLNRFGRFQIVDLAPPTATPPRLRKPLVIHAHGKFRMNRGPVDVRVTFTIAPPDRVHVAVTDGTRTAKELVTQQFAGFDGDSQGLVNAWQHDDMRAALWRLPFLIGDHATREGRWSHEADGWARLASPLGEVLRVRSDAITRDVLEVHLRAPDGAFIDRMSDYRDVPALGRMPFSLEWRSFLSMKLELVVDEIKVVDAVDEGLFQPRTKQLPVVVP